MNGCVFREFNMCRRRCHRQSSSQAVAGGVSLWEPFFVHLATTHACRKLLALHQRYRGTTHTDTRGGHDRR